MIRRLVFLPLLFLATFFNTLDQQDGKDGKERDQQQAVKTPREVFLPVVAFQPDCPLKLEPSDAITYLNGGDATILSCRNQGTKPIRSYTVAWLNSLGGEEKVTMKDGLLLPGESERILDKSPSVSLIPINDKIRSDLKLDGPMKAIIIFFVVRAEFADGAEYKDDKVYNATKDYFEKFFR